MGTTYLMDQMSLDGISYECFGQNQISKIFCCGTNVFLMFWTGPNVLQRHVQNSSLSNILLCVVIIYLSIVSVW